MIAARSYQQAYAWSAGLDANSSEFRLYWMNLLFAQFAVEAVAAASIWGYLWFSRPEDLGRVGISGLHHSWHHIVSIWDDTPAAFCRSTIAAVDHRGRRAIYAVAGGRIPRMGAQFLDFRRTFRGAGALGVRDFRLVGPGIGRVAAAGL